MKSSGNGLSNIVINIRVIRMKHKKNDELTKFQNRVEPEFTVEYLFIEKAKEQIEPINDDQGYQMGCIYIYTRGWYINNNLEDFLEILLDHLIYSLKEYDRFKNKTLDLKDYKFFLIDRDKNATEFAELDEEFYEALTHSL